MFGKKKKEEAPTRKDMSSSERREVEEVIAQAKAQQTLSLDDLMGVAGGVIEQQDVPSLMGWLSVIKAGAPGLTKEEVKAKVPAYLSQLQQMYPNITQKDVEDFIDANF